MATAVLAVLLFATSLAAQANDWAGLRIFTLGVGSAPGAPATLTCGAPFSCTPASFTITQGSPVMAVTLGAPLNGLYAIAASLDVANLVCLPLGLPGVVHELVLPPANLVTISVGVNSQSDNGRCNGGSSGALTLFTMPTGLPPGAIAFQAVQVTPLSVGGTGLALSNCVVMNY
jgi:hypothetical protein